MSTSTKKSFDDLLLEGLDEWRKNHPNALRWDNDVVIDWLVENRQYGLEKRVVRKELVKRLAKAQNRKRVRNKQNKKVRAFHAAKLPVRQSDGKIVQKTFWGYRLELDASFAHASMDQRQKQAAGLCKSMFNDAEDLNINNANLKGQPIQLELDFTYVTGEKQKPNVQVIPTDAKDKMENRALRKKNPR